MVSVLAPVYIGDRLAAAAAASLGVVTAVAQEIDARVRRDVEAVIRRAESLGDALVPAVFGALLDRLDVAELIRRHVDLNAVVADVDIDAILARIDLVGLAEYIVGEIDLPEIIRESTGTISTEAVRGLRMQGIEADQAIGRFVDRLMLRHGPRMPSPRVPDDETRP